MKDDFNKITGITEHSTKVLPGFIFVASKGASASSKDGHDFIPEAIARGASMVIVDKNYLGPSTGADFLTSSNTKETLCYLCEAFYNFPSKKIKLIGITGTNGKTSTTFLLHSILETAGLRASVMGTLGCGHPQNLVPASHTTMEPEFLSKHLDEQLKMGVSHVIMEVSSHALSLNRVEALDFSVVALSNITPEHLDFHGTLADYIKAKGRLFFELAKENTQMVLPLSHPFDLSTIKAGNISYFDNSGDFYEQNQNLAAAIARKLDIKEQDIELGLKKCPPIKGRFEQVISAKKNAPKVFVDFAHTPDALKMLLKRAQNISHKKIILVFGCGGNRDQEKRPVMGAIASKFADVIYVTDDNPRNEDERLIRKSIIKGIIPNNNLAVFEIADRKKAISEAICQADPNDIVLIAGKGHETYQIYGLLKQAFSDQEVALEVLENYYDENR